MPTSGEIVAALDAALTLEGVRYLYHLAEPIARRVLIARFGAVAAPDVPVGGKRLGHFFSQVGAKTEAAGITNAELDEAFARPEITAAIYAACDSAIDTEDTFKVATLADLVVARLRASDDSIDAPAARLALERMRDVTTLQTQLLAYVRVLNYDPMHRFYRKDRQYDDQALSTERENFVRWLVQHVSNLTMLPYAFADFTHLRSLGLLDFTMWEHTAFESGFTPIVITSTVVLFAGLASDERVAETLRRVHLTADPRSRLEGVPMIAASSVTPAGGLIAAQALYELSGLELR